jgi:hypothetical protein
MNALKEMPGVTVLTAMCQCDLAECVCGMTERALRWWMSPHHTWMPMTPEQREWCLAEIDSVEGYRRADYEDVPDSQLARGVLDAWRDYCRDKGLL